MILSLQDLKNQRLVWSAGQANSSANPSASRRHIPSGHVSFDQCLEGWPSSGLVELQLPAWGIGELRLILPALSHLAGDAATQNKLQVWLTENVCLMPQALDSAYASNTVVLENLGTKQSLWALETLLTSGVCSVLICWLPQLTSAQAKRLQVAAKESGTLVFCLREISQLEHSLPISLRLQLSPTDQGLMIDVLKRQNAQPVEPFELDLLECSPQLYQQATKPDVHAYQHNIVPFPSQSIELK